MSVRRDRDPSGRALNARPRDKLGRPLPYGSVGVPRQPPAPPDRSVDETLQLAQALLDDGRPFEAHEVFEDAWKSADEPDRQLWRGLAQLAVGFTHVLRGNPSGGRALLERGSDNVARYPGLAPAGLDVPGVLAWADVVLNSLAAGSIDEPPVPRLRGTR